MKCLILFLSAFWAALSAQAVETIDKNAVVELLNARRAAYLSGDPSALIKSAANDITVTMISSVVEGPGGTRQMRLPQYVPFLKQSFANTDYLGYKFNQVNAQFADDGQSAKIFVDVQEEARVQGLPVSANKALVIVVELQGGEVKVSSLTEKIESVRAGGQFGSALVEPSGQSANLGQGTIGGQGTSAGSGSTAMTIDQGGGEE